MNVLIFGPNGSGKGTQGAVVQKKMNVPHIESGAIFRKAIGAGTALGQQAKAYIDRGDLVPDEITIPMILERLQEPDCQAGWLLDGFPRNPAQARSLHEALSAAGMKLDYVIEIELAREVAKLRITGRRLCVNDNNHPNHVAFPAIQPVQKGDQLVCRVCGGDLKTRADDQDEAAIAKRHDIYYDAAAGTMAAVNYFKALPGLRVVAVDGSASIDAVSQAILAQLG